MIDYAKKSDIAIWKAAGNHLADYDTKSWGMAWIAEKVGLKAGMSLLDVGHGTNHMFADYCMARGVEFCAMDRILSPESARYAETLEEKGGRYIDGYCTGDRPDEGLGEKFDIVVSIGVLEHTIGWGFPSNIFPILYEQLFMLKKGGTLVNVYEPTLFIDSPFNIRHDIAFLTGYLEFAPNSHPSSLAIPSLYDLATDPDTILSCSESNFPSLKGRNSWTAMGYIASKQRDMPLSHVAKHSTASPPADSTDLLLNLASPESIRDALSGYSGLVLFGSGSRLEKYYPVLAPRLIRSHLLGIADNNPQKWGSTFDGVEIGPPDEMIAKKPDLIIICSIHYLEIMAQLGGLADEAGVSFDIRVV